jgi:hypothetical protein
MDTAIPWYKSRTILILIAGMLLSIGAKFGILPREVTQDQIVDFLIWFLPLFFAALARFSSTKVVTTSKAKAEDINASGVIK